MNTKYFIVTVLAVIAALFVGCASVQKAKQAQETMVRPEQQQTEQQVAVQKHSKRAPREVKYLVKKGDSLWKISAKKSVYGDPFEWPLLFKANRDQIVDPDLIAVNQELGVKKEFDDSVIDDAKQEAKDTPPYKAHSEPRKELPLKY
jgi:hypothetical protein